MPLVAVKAFATEYLQAPYHPSSAVRSVPANTDSPMLLARQVAAVGEDQVVLYNNYHPLSAVRSVVVNTDSPMLSVEQVAAQDADLVVL